MKRGRPGITFGPASLKQTNKTGTMGSTGNRGITSRRVTTRRGDRGRSADGSGQSAGARRQARTAVVAPALRAALAVVVAVFAATVAWPAAAVAAPGGASPWELTSVHAPTNVPLRPSVNQVMTLRFHANVGKFLLEFENEQTEEEGETKYLPFDATAKEVQQALEKLKSGEPKTAIGAGNVLVSGGYDPETETGTYTIEFTGALGGRYLGEERAGDSPAK